VRILQRETRRALDEAGPDEEQKRRQAVEDVEALVGNYDAHEVGINLAARMEQARINGEATVRLPLGSAYGALDDSERRFIAGTILRIALIVRKHLPEHAAGVRHVIILFGVVNNVKSEVIDLPE